MSRKGSTMDNEEGLREAFATFDKASIYFYILKWAHESLFFDLLSALFCVRFVSNFISNVILTYQ